MRIDEYMEKEMERKSNINFSIITLKQKFKWKFSAQQKKMKKFDNCGTYVTYFYILIWDE